MNRRLRSRFHRLFPDLQNRVQKKQAEQAASHNNSKHLRSFKVDGLVYTKDFSSTPLIWVPGTVVKVTGPLSYHIKLTDNRVVRRHVDAVRARHDNSVRSPLNDSSFTRRSLSSKGSKHYLSSNTMKSLSQG